MKKFLAYLLSTLALIVSIVACQPAPDRIVIGSKNFTEQLILGEILAQQIEAKTTLKVDRKFNLGGTLVCHQGILSGDLDLYPEYTGTALTTILKQPANTNPQQVLTQVKQGYRDRFKLEWTAPFGFNNTFAMIIRGDDARQFKLQTLSQAAIYTPKWRAGFGPEFLNREDGFPGLSKVYNLKFADSPKTMDLGLLYRALTEKQVDLVAGNSTDGLIASLGLVVLEDDRHYFPPYEAAAVVRQATLQKHPELQAVLDELGGKLSEVKMRELNYRVDGKKEAIKQVVQEFLQIKK